MPNTHVFTGLDGAITLAVETRGRRATPPRR